MVEKLNRLIKQIQSDKVKGTIHTFALKWRFKYSFVRNLALVLSPVCYCVCVSVCFNLSVYVPPTLLTFSIWRQKHQMENLPIKTKKINKKLFLTDASLYCRLAENSNARPVLLNRNQLLSERLETVQCEMHFFGVIFNFSRVFLISASKTRHIPPRGAYNDSHSGQETRSD